MILQKYLTENQLEALKYAKNVSLQRLDEFITWLSSKYNVIGVHPFFDTFSNRIVFVEVDVLGKEFNDTYDVKMSKKIKKEMKKVGFSDFIDLIYFIFVPDLSQDESEKKSWLF